MNNTITALVLGASIVAQVILELKGIKVPTIIYLLSGFAVRHIIGGDTVKDTSTVSPSSTTALSLLLIGLVLMGSGCSSAGMNTSCGHIVASGTYATANGNGAGFLCHQGCLGFNCPKPDYDTLAAVSTAYINANSAVTTTVPITVSLVPTAATTPANQTTGVVTTAK